MIRLLIALLIVTGAIYFPGLSGGFFFDDAWNIENNSSIKITTLSLDSLQQVIASGESGPLKRPISMVSFAINYYFTGKDPYYFKLVNLCIHLLNGLALFFLTRLLLNTYKQYKEPTLTDKSIAWISLAVTAAWLLQPLNLTSILYIVQRMTSLSALFVIFGMISYLLGRQRLASGEGGTFQIIASVIIFFPLAILSKENGALLPAFTLIIEATFFHFLTKTKRDKIFLLIFFGITIIMPFIFSVGYLVLHPETIVAGYQIRDFTLYERLLTEARILWMYIQMIILPIGQNYSLFHDDIGISRGLLQPISTLFSILGIIALIILAIYSRRRLPLITFAILFFLVGHSMESTFIGLELAHEHRNYLAQYGILLALFYYALLPPIQLKRFQIYKAFPYLLILAFGITTALRANAWGTQEGFSLAEINNHPNSPRANYQIGRIYATLAERTNKTPRFDHFFNLARTHFIRSAQLKRNYTDGLFALLILHSSNNRDIDQESLAILQRRIKTEPVTSNSINQISNLVRCYNANTCHIDDDKIRLVLEAALSNPTLKGKSRSIVLASMGDYYGGQPKKYVKAITAFQEAADISPKNPAYMLKLTDLYIKTNQLDTARQRLELSKKLDVWNKYYLQIQYLQNRLSEMRANAQDNIAGSQAN